MRRARDGRARRRLLVHFLVVAVLTATAEPAIADSTASFARDVEAAARHARERAAARWDFQAERALVERLDGLADRFHRLAEAGAAIASPARTLIEACEKTRSRYTAVLEKLQADVIARDGDLEAVQDSDAWRQRELLAMRLLYRLNWLRYDTAMRYERTPARRKQLLEEALSGFAEFVGAADAELRVEALLGHGLANKALKRYDSAISDLRAGLDEHPDADMAERLRIGLVEALIAAGRTSEAVGESRRLTGRGPLARFARAKALIVGLDRGRRELVAEARAALARLAAAGPQWRRKARQLIDAGLRDPLVLSGGDPSVTILVADSLRRRGECRKAVPVYESLLRPEPSADVLYGLGECAFENGSAERAGDYLGRFLEGAPPSDPRVKRAAYLRFKAAELEYVGAREPLDGPVASKYEAALRGFLERAPDHPRAGEAWFRLGEWHKKHGDYRECHDAFARVTEDRGVSFQAHFLGAQCLVEAVEHGGDPALAVDALDAVVREYEAASEPAKRRSTTLAAKAALMAASLAPRVPDHGPEARLARLRDFERRFSPPPDLAAQAALLRVGALRSLGRLSDAAAEVERLTGGEAAAAIDAETFKKLAVTLVRDASKLEEGGDREGARAARRASAAVYRYLLAQADAGRLELDASTRESISQLLERLGAGDP